MVPFKLGVSLLQADLDDYLRKLNQLGYSYLYFGGRFFEQSDRDLAQAARRCAEHGILPFAAHAPGHFLPADPAELDTMLERHQRFFDKAAMLGCRSVTHHIGSVEGVRNEETARYISQVGADQFDAMNFRMVHELAGYAHSIGLKLAIENLSRDIVNNYVRDIPAIKRVIAGAGNPAGVGINVDTGHANISGLDPAAMIREAGSLLIETHFNDNFGWMEPVNSTNDIHRVPGIGTVHWVSVVAALVEIEYPNPIIFELGPKFEQDTVDTFLTLAYHNWRQFEAVYSFHQATLAAPIAN